MVELFLIKGRNNLTVTSEKINMIMSTSVVYSLISGGCVPFEARMSVFMWKEMLLLYWSIELIEWNLDDFYSRKKPRPESLEKPSE